MLQRDRPDRHHVQLRGHHHGLSGADHRCRRRVAVRVDVDQQRQRRGHHGRDAYPKGGVYTITITAKNSVGHATQNFTLTADQTPAVTDAAKATATVGTAFSFAVATTGFPLPALTAAGLPSG